MTEELAHGLGVPNPHLFAVSSLSADRIPAMEMVMPRSRWNTRTNRRCAAGFTFILATSEITWWPTPPRKLREWPPNSPMRCLRGEACRLSTRNLDYWCGDYLRSRTSFGLTWKDSISRMHDERPTRRTHAVASEPRRSRSSTRTSKTASTDAVIMMPSKCSSKIKWEHCSYRSVLEIYVPGTRMGTASDV